MAAGAGRADGRRDRWEFGHRTRDRPTGTSRWGRGHPHRTRSGAARARRDRDRQRTASRPSTPPTSIGSERSSTSCRSPIDHVLVTGPGPYYAPLTELDLDAARRDVEAHLLLPIVVAQNAANTVRPGGTLLFMSGTGGRSTAPGLALIAALTAAQPALIRNLALEAAPIRVNLIAAGFVDTPLSASLLGDELEVRREELRSTLPIRRGHRSRRHRRPRRPHHDQHRAHRRHLRHRRRPAARPR